MKLYILRSVKYFLSLVLLYLCATSLFSALGLSLLNVEESLQIMFTTSRGVSTMIIVMVLSLFYPKFGFAKRSVKGGTIKHNRAAIISSFEASGLCLKSESKGEMIFGAKDIHRRVVMLFEDKTTLRESDGELIIEGTRRNAALIAYRLSGKIEAKN